ncbi:hypothetical protein QKG08_14990 [Clavibacter michiganensis]|uniref:hypothetical protein n=1 Tax=Clavibacter michiganensis TaxID=28447 RepID=UPI0026DBF6D8|nr:hypothetical protein [Clavibacter michiganensis]MDO4070358.1 hypothetical protein [Clavibacter michiganensis]
MDYDAVRRTVDDAIAAMLATDEEPPVFIRGWFPAGNCEYAAIAIAVALEDRGLGQWTLVTAKRPDGNPQGHAWLELRDDDGTVLFSIDYTIEQFPWLSTVPFVGEGRTPAADEFTAVQYEGVLWDWDYLGDESHIFQRLIRAVQAQLDAAGLRSQT